MFLFQKSPSNISIEFTVVGQHSSQNKSIPQTNLFYLCHPIALMPKDFTITTPDSSYKFNKNMIKRSSLVLQSLIKNDSEYSQFQLKIKDGECAMGKLERLYLGEQVTFYKKDYSITKDIVEILNIKNFPSFDYNNDETQVKINDDSFLKILQSYDFAKFIISIKNKKYKYYCNVVGVQSSNVIKRFISMNPNSNSYSYDFDDSKREFISICQFFNFVSLEDIQIPPENLLAVKKIVEDLEIHCILDKINSFIRYNEYSISVINSKIQIFESIEELFQCLFNRKNLSVESVKDIIINSVLSQTERNVKEMVACFIRVIHSDASTHPFLISLIELLDKSKSDKKELEIFLPFLIQRLMENIGINFLNCAFIYKLSKKGIISREEIVETIYSILYYQDKNLQPKEKYEPFDFINKYINKINDRIYSKPSYARAGEIGKCAFNALLWFFPEVIEDKNITIDYIRQKDFRGSFLRKYSSNIDKFKEMRDSGEPDDDITKVLRHDNIDELQSIIQKEKFNNFIIPFNIFDSFDEQPSYINYAAACGSIKCFKYLLENKCMMDNNASGYAAFGQNKEIIDIIDQMESYYFIHTSLYNKSFTPTEVALLRHDDDLFNSINGNFDVRYDKIIPLFENYNAKLIIKILKEGFDIRLLKKEELSKLIEITASSGFSFLTELIFKLIFVKFNTKYPQDPSTMINFEDSVFFGNLSMLKLYATLNVQNINFKYPLAISIIKGYFDIVEYSVTIPFIQQYRICSKDIRKLIKLAIYKKDSTIFNCLLDQFGKQIIIDEYPIKSNDFLLDYACAFNNIIAAKSIVDLIIKYRPKTDYTVPFIYAAMHRYDEICNYMIDKKIYLNFQMIINCSLDFSKASTKIFVSLLNCIDEEMKRTFLSSFFYDAIKNGNKELVEYLLHNDACYDNALFIVSEFAHDDIEIADIILKNDNTPFFINKLSKNGSAINIAVKSENIKIVKRLLSIPGIDLKICVNKETPLVSAFSSFNLDMINLLYDYYGNDIQSQTWQINEALKIVLAKISEDKQKKYESLAPDVIMKFIEIKSFDINCQVNNLTLLSYACKTNLKNIVEKMMQSDDIDLNTRSFDNGDTPLMIAISNKNFEIAILLLKSERIKINMRNFSDSSALTIASEINATDIVDIIINDKRFNSTESNLNLAFYLSAKNVSKQLISLQNLDVNYQMTGLKNSSSLFEEDDKNDSSNKFSLDYRFYLSLYKTSLMKSVYFRNPEKIDMILHHSSFDPVKSQVKLAILIALNCNNVYALNIMLPFIDNDINYHLLNDESLLVLASRFRSKEIIQEIVSNSNFDPVKSQIFSACAEMLSQSEVRIDLLDLLLKYDVKHIIDFSQLLPNGKSFFTILNHLYYNIDSVVDYLVKHGADPNCPDKYGQYPLQYAINKSSSNMVKALLKHAKIDLSQKIQYLETYNEYTEIRVSSTYLHLAAQSDYSIFQDILYQKVIGINETDSQGETPLMIAARYKKCDIITKFFDINELDYLHTNLKGENVLDISSQCGHYFWFKKNPTKDHYYRKLMELCSPPK